MRKENSTCLAELSTAACRPIVHTLGPELLTAEIPAARACGRCNLGTGQHSPRLRFVASTGGLLAGYVWSVALAVKRVPTVGTAAPYLRWGGAVRA